VKGCALFHHPPKAPFTTALQQAGRSQGLGMLWEREVSSASEFTSLIDASLHAKHRSRNVAENKRCPWERIQPVAPRSGIRRIHASIQTSLCLYGHFRSRLIKGLSFPPRVAQVVAMRAFHCRRDVHRLRPLSYFTPT